MSSTRVFEMPEHWAPVPGLHERIKALIGDGRYRTAMAELLDLLRQDPSNVEAAATRPWWSPTPAARNCSTPKEPLTNEQRSSAILAPIATQCSVCDNFWVFDPLCWRNPEYLSVAEPAGFSARYAGIRCAKNAPPRRLAVARLFRARHPGALASFKHERCQPGAAVSSR